MYFPNADKAQNTICSSPGRKRKWFLLSSRSTHNFIARSYSCISKVATVIDSQHELLCHVLSWDPYTAYHILSGERIKRGTRPTLVLSQYDDSNELKASHVPGAFGVTLTMSSSKLKRPIIHAISVVVIWRFWPTLHSVTPAGHPGPAPSPRPNPRLSP